MDILKLYFISRVEVVDNYMFSPQKGDICSRIFSVSCGLLTYPNYLDPVNFHFKICHFLFRKLPNSVSWVLFQTFLIDYSSFLSLFVVF